MIKHLTDIVSKMAVLPFTEEVFLYNDYFEDLIKDKDDEIYRNYDELKNKVQKVIREKFNVKNVDMIKLLFEQYFPLKLFRKSENVDELYLEHLRKLSKSFICHRNGKIALKYWKNSNDEKMFGAFDNFNKIELWNTFSRQFCIDILVVMYLIDNEMHEEEYLNGYYWLINVGDLQLDNILERGVAENHIHINAGLNFNFFWEELMNLSHNRTESRNIFNNLVQQKYLRLINMISIIRVILISFLYEYEVNFNMNFHCSRYVNINKESDDDLKKCNYIITKFIHGEKIDEEEIYFKNLYENLTKEIKSIKDLFNIKIDTTDENIFLFKAIKYLSFNKNDLIFSKLFWKYVIFKNVIYECITQNNYIEGLDYFTEYYSRASYSKRKYKEHLEISIKNQIYNNNLKKLEIRLNPSSSKNSTQIKIDIKNILITFFTVYKEILNSKIPYDKIPTIGIVFHMIKRNDDTFFEKCWYLDCNSKDINKKNYAYGNLQKIYIETVKVLNDIRENIPKISNYIVGIDAASIENNVEPWVFAPVYNIARDSRTNRLNLVFQKFESINNLGFTYHVGEDYRHLLSGLRHIDEVIEHFGYHAGDRIGHGIALGIDAKDWCYNNPVVFMPRIEYLENMLWIWGLCYNDIIDTSKINMTSFEREIMTQAHAIYVNIEGITLYNLWLAYQNKFIQFQPKEKFLAEICEEETIKASLFCSKVDKYKGLFWNEEKLLHAYHCKCYVERMYEVIQIKVTEKDIKLLAYLQSAIRKKINKNGIVVETNPTSNLAISGIESLFKHHVTNLNTKGLESFEECDKGLVITVNSDDPIVFNTSISNELAYIFYLLQDKGYSRDSILEWIEKIRRWGLDTSFIRYREMKKQELVDEIEDIIKELK